jgi:hypothetical protein
MNSEAIWSKIESADVVKFDNEQRKMLNSVLNSDVVISALATIYKDINATDSLQKVDLTTPEGVMMAAKMQSRVVGMLQFLEELISLAELEHDDEENEDG